MSRENDIRNICVIAHVDHGKTTLVDAMFKQAGLFRDNEHVNERLMDVNDLEKERGITIFSKNAAVTWKGVKINIVDTPGHSDFGGEVQRILKMVDGALLLVDAVDGPMPQTKYVLKNALATGLAPVVVINKIDRKDARPDWVLNQVFDLFVALGANDEQLDFHTVYASARNGVATLDSNVPGESMAPLFDTILSDVAAPVVDMEKPFRMLVTSVEYDNYLGRVAVGKIDRGKIFSGDSIAKVDRGGDISFTKVMKLFTFDGPGKHEVDEARAGDIAVVAGGFKELDIGETIADRDFPEALPAIEIDKPTISMDFSINTSPFAGLSGDKLTGRHLEERLTQELRSNLALKVERAEGGEAFKVSGRGELHLTILIETMRREGFELSVSRPQIITSEVDGRKMEPEEFVIVDVDEGFSGKVIEKFGSRKGEMKNMANMEKGRVRLEFTIPARGLIGMHSELLTETRGSAALTHSYHRLIEWAGVIEGRRTGSLISQDKGTATGYALDKLSDRGEFFIKPGTEVYAGMVIGESNKGKDLVVNSTKGKKLTNMRSVSQDDNLKLAPPRLMSLEQCLEYLTDDELAEITPDAIRIRKKYLDADKRKKQRKKNEAA
ncbi:GTP-binding protein TypA/BipA [hydrothermal vent metagenome]|uniref:GTP-binding protein TypA/BipA n=1 Tax=hydrothermal vent metagenome TaxID=652676 RepID=A0A3B1CSZ6_9ZZZZ